LTCRKRNSRSCNNGNPRELSGGAIRPSGPLFPFCTLHASGARHAIQIRNICSCNADCDSNARCHAAGERSPRNRRTIPNTPAFHRKCRAMG
jgi:hypothetical protein